MKHRFFEMNLFNVIRVGGQSLMVMLFTLSSSFITAYLVGKAIKIDGKTTTLIGMGTSICGGSAIAATAPVIQAKDEDVAQAISTIFLFNIIAVFIFPPLGHLLGLSDTGFGMWAMTAIELKTNIKRLLTNGLKPIFLGLCCWFAVAVVSLITQHFTGMI